MIVITGSTGQIGSMVVKNLLQNRQSVIAIARNFDKANQIFKGAEIRIADLMDRSSLQKAMQGGKKLFVFTPEDFTSPDIIEDAKILINNYRSAAVSVGIEKVVVLSSMGAQIGNKGGMLYMSKLLEEGFINLPLETVIIRPAFYYSNWLNELNSARENGIIQSFIPVHQKIPMVAPPDVSKFIANSLQKSCDKNLYEIAGPDFLNALDVASILSELLNKKIEAIEIPEEQWMISFQQAGFSDSVATNIHEMTKALKEGRAVPEGEITFLGTSLKEYLKIKLQS